MAAQKKNNPQPPSMEELSLQVATPLWRELLRHAQEAYQAIVSLDYSRCSMLPGWNVKLKKGGRSLCTLYPMEQSFDVLVVIGERERMRAEAELPLFSSGFQALYRETEASMGQKWLLVHVADEAALADVKRCMAIRRGAPAPL